MLISPPPFRLFAGLVIGLSFSLSSQALEKQFVAFKQTQFTPISNEDSVFPDDSIDFDSTTFTELTYSSPTSKKFSVEISALLNTEQEVDQLKALVNWGGIVLVTSQGTIEGSFSETDEARFPGNQDPDELFQTLLPEEREFKGESQFIALGVEAYGDRIVGIGYHKTVAPVLLSVDAYQNSEFGYNRRTGEFENYNEEGNYPYQAVDAEGTIETFGLWVRFDPLKNSFEKVAKEGKRDMGFFFAADLMTGIATYTPGDQVEVDYANATEEVASDVGSPGEGTTLSVSSSTSLITNRLIYGVGYQAVMPVDEYIVGGSLGVEGTLQTNLFESDTDLSGELFTEGFNAGYGIFFRVAAAF